jgi:hypothetical protein
MKLSDFGKMSKNARTPEQNISLRNLCKNFWLEEIAILDMQMSKLPMISGYVVLPYALICIYLTLDIQRKLSNLNPE